MAETIIYQGHPKYKLNEFRENSHKHLAVILTDKWMARNRYTVYKPFWLEDRYHNMYFFEGAFVSDGGTFPIWLAPFLRYNGKGMAAFLCHDQFCYRANDSGMYSWRTIGDHALAGHLIECGVNRWIAKKAGSAVKRYGELLKARGELK